MNKNPFSPVDKDRHDIWEMLVKRDIQAFIQKDWTIVRDDFLENNFFGIDAGRVENPDAWRIKFPDLKSYKKIWLEQARKFGKIEWKENLEEALFHVTVLRDIEICGDRALAHKKFFGQIKKLNGESVSTDWQTLYFCLQVKGVWKIAGFCGFMPHFTGKKTDASLPAKKKPPIAIQHKTAGPYSPVLSVNPGQIIVISGQAAIDLEGKVIGDTIEQQTKHTFENCRKQLNQADCDLNDVFKVNVYLKNLDDWSKFNEIYEKYFSEPRPVRTTIEAGLLLTMLVEIEMWAVKL